MNLEQKIVEMQLKSAEMDMADIGVKVMQIQEMSASQVLKSVLRSTLSSISIYVVNFTRNFVTSLKNAINSKISSVRSIIKSLNPKEITKDII